jgi:MATE family multidrug resistance protein
MMLTSRRLRNLLTLKADSAKVPANSGAGAAAEGTVSPAEKTVARAEGTVAPADTAWKKEVSVLFKIGVPVMITQVLQMSMGVVDTIMTGRLSAESLGAVAVGNGLLMPLFVLGLGCMMSVTPIVAQHVGARAFHEIGKNARHVLWLGFILSFPVFFTLRNLDPVFPWIGVTEELIPISTGYLDAMSWGIFPIFAYAGLRYFHEGLSVTRPAMFIALTGLLINIAANYVLMYGKLGFPAMGAVGTGYASSFVALIMFLLMLIFTINFTPYRRFEIFTKFRLPDPKHLKELLQIGGPIGLSASMEVTLFAVVGLMISTIGAVEIAGHQIALNVASLMFMIPFGLSVAISTRVGNAIGRKRLDLARFRGRTGILSSTSLMLFTGGFMFLFPVQIASIYSSEPDVLALASQLIIMAAIFQISDGLQVSGYGALRGLKDTSVPMLVNFFSYWLIGIPTAYYLGTVAGGGPRGMWFGLIAGLSVAAILHNVRFQWMTSPKQERFKETL